MENTFCKVEDISYNKYILTDKNKQLLQCMEKKNSDVTSCHIFNLKKAIDDPKILDNLENIYDDTNIPCKLIMDANDEEAINSEVIDKSKIKFDDYNIASINKDMIKNKDGTQMTDDKIYESIYKPLGLLYLSTNNKAKLDASKTTNDYIQKLLIEENETKLYPTEFNIKPSNDNTKSNNDNTIIFSSVLGIVIFILLCLFIFKYRETIHKYFF